MIGKFSIFNFQFSILILFLILIALFLLNPNPYTLTPVSAQACPVQSINPRVTNGLISAPAIISNKFSNTTGTCAVDPSKISFAPYKIPSYDDLKSIYFDQSKLPSAQKIILSGNQNQNSSTFPINLTSDIFALAGYWKLDECLGTTVANDSSASGGTALNGTATIGAGGSQISAGTCATTPGVAYWKMDENSGTNVSDSSISGSNGGTTNGNWGVGYTNNALSFDGISSIATFSNSTNQIVPASNGPFSIAFWFRPTNIPAISFGFKGDYYTNYTYTNPLPTTTPTISRTDASIDFDWAQGSPDASISTDSFGVRWTGKIAPPSTGIYTFYTTVNDGVRLWVNNQLIIDQWITANNSQSYSGTITLTGGQAYDIKLEFFENTQKASVKLEWSGPGGTPVRQVLSAPYVVLPNTSIPQVYSLMNNEVLSTSGFRFGIDNKAYGTGSTNLYFWSSENGGGIDLHSVSTITNNNWYHVVISYSGSSAKMYLNGNLETTDLSGSIISNTNSLYLGRQISGKLFYNGLIDEVRVFNFAVTNTQSNTLYQNSNTTLAPPTAWANGAIGKYNASLNFDGTDDVVSIGNTINNVQGVSFWVKPASNPANMLTLTASAYISSNSSGAVSATGFTTPTIYVNGSTSGTVTTGVWNHIAVTTNTGISASAIRFGLANAVYLNGQIDDVRMYNRVLAPGEITGLYNSTNSSIDKIYWVQNGDLTIMNDVMIVKSGLVFVDGNLSINQNITQDLSSTGLVFIVKGDIIIAPPVTQINGVLISSGRIYTAGAGCSHTTPVNAGKLTVNGSLVTLDASKNIEFCRTLGASNSTTAAEAINNQSKYLVILRDLYSETLQKWSEIQ